MTSRDSFWHGLFYNSMKCSGHPGKDNTAADYHRSDLLGFYGDRNQSSDSPKVTAENGAGTEVCSVLLMAFIRDFGTSGVCS